MWPDAFRRSRVTGAARFLEDFVWVLSRGVYPRWWHQPRRS
jgi:hypothetical protein